MAITKDTVITTETAVKIRHLSVFKQNSFHICITLGGNVHFKQVFLNQICS